MASVIRGLKILRCLLNAGTSDATLAAVDVRLRGVIVAVRHLSGPIEVLGDEDIHFLIFFDQPMPYDVGYRASATAISREVMAATFEVDEGVVPKFPQTTLDPLIVGRFNPVEPVAALTVSVAA